MRWKTSNLSGWGRNRLSESRVARPERYSEFVRSFDNTEDGGVIAHGAGRSYGDTALNENGHVVLTTRLNRFIGFDGDTEELIVEPGVTFNDVVNVFLPKGYMVPTSPGTATVTIGGAVANDIHGKNHDVVGSFGQHVRWLELLLPNGEIVRISPEENARLFDATVGGIGLTGLITAVCFKLMKVPSAFVATKEQRMADLDQFVEAFAALTDEEMIYSVGWIDGMAQGASLGRGILEVSRPIDSTAAHNPIKRHTVPFNFPNFAINSWSVRAFNEIYYRRIPNRGRERELPYDVFLFPLDAILEWNRIYGKRGFFQFQCVLPLEQSRDGLRKLLEEVAKSHAASFLAVLKTLGDEGRGLLSFPMKGFTLAFDFPRNPGVVEVLNRLEAIVRDHGGRIYLAKDSCLSAEGFADMYPKAKEFRAVLEDIDPKGVMASDMSRRLGLRATT